MNTSDEMNDFKEFKENGSKYFYDQGELRKVFKKEKIRRGITGAKLIGLISDETGIPAETIRNHLRTDSAAKKPKIERVKKYGKFFLGNEYALLKPIPKPNEVPDSLPEELHNESVKAIFSMLYDILAQYESSGCYNYIPGTKNTDGAWQYFEGMIGNVRKKLIADFLGKRDDTVCKKLEQIIDETEIFVKSYSVPGVVLHWKKINPQIFFFDCVFDMIDKLGAETARELFLKGLFEDFPDSNVIKARKNYFVRKRSENTENNLQYSEERLFQNELLLTLAMVFENDFGGSENNSQSA